MKLVKFFEKNMCLIISFVLVCIISVSLVNSSLLPEHFEGQNDVPTCCLFHADWCPHCTKLMPVWNEFKQKHGGKCKIVEVEAKEKNVMKKHDVNGYPTIKFLPNGLSNPEGSKEFKGERDVDSLASFVDENTKEKFTEYMDETEERNDEETDEETDDENDGHESSLSGTGSDIVNNGNSIQGVDSSIFRGY